MFEIVVQNWLRSAGQEPFRRASSRVQKESVRDVQNVAERMWEEQSQCSVYVCLRIIMIFADEMED